MVAKLSDKREVNGLITLLASTYMVSYITRINFGAVASEICYSTGMAKSLLSTALTGSFIAYGAGQIFCGILGDLVSPKKMIAAGLCITIVMNLLIPLCEVPWQMVIVWSINGLAQACMWPPMVRMMTQKFTAQDYQTAATRISWGGSFGTISVYLVSPVIIALVGWKGVFVTSAISGAIMLLVWGRKAPDGGTPRKKEATTEERTAAKGWFSPMVLCVMIAIMLQGMLRDGVTTWMPAFITENFNAGSELAIMTSVVLPIFSIISFQATKMLYQKIVKNPLACACLLFGSGAIAALLLSIFNSQSVVVSVILSAVLTGCMHGVNLLLICMVPQYFEKWGNVATLSGVLNACTYVGSALFTYGVAALSEQMGWQATIISWLLIATLGCAICAVSILPWKKRFPG